MSTIRVLVSSLAIGLATAALAGVPVPEYSSRPGAAYTLYLNFGGFAYTGSWGGKTPGTVPAYSTDGTTSSFSPTELSNIQQIWAGISEKYTMFDINVTTLDPAVAAGESATDLQRQNYYALTARTMHSVIGGNGSWYGSAGGVSFVGVADLSLGPAQSEYKTNWTFPGALGNSTKNIIEAAAHEDGHALGLGHQVDIVRNEGYSSNNNSNGNGSFAPTMGVGYYSQRSLWRNGTDDLSNPSSMQNDIETMLTSMNGLTMLDDGIGHSLATATPLGYTGNFVDSLVARGFIRPESSTDPVPLGVDSYTRDYYAFSVTGGPITLNLVAGGQRITAGVSDGFATFDGNLTIRNSAGNVVGTGVKAADTMSSTYTVSDLPAGNYYAEISSVGGYTSANEPAVSYFTTGSYFLTGTGNFAPVPEPASMAVLGLGLAALRRRRRR